MKPPKLSFVFNRLNKLNKEGKGLIQMRIYVSGYTPVYYSIEESIFPYQWGSHGEVCNYEFSDDINNKMDELLLLAKKYWRKNKNCSTSDIRDFLKGEKKEEMDFLNYCNAIRKGLTGYAGSYLKNHDNTLKYLKKFIGRKKINFQDVDYSFINSFKRFLERQKSNRDGNRLKAGYINVMLSILKTYTNEAIKEKLLLVNPFLGVKLNGIKKKHVNPISYDEIEKIRKLDLSNRRGNVGIIRDGVVFSALTGWRFSDVFGSNKEKYSGLKVKDLILEDKGYRIVRLAKKGSESNTTKGEVINMPLWKLPNDPYREIEKRIKSKKPNDLVFCVADNKGVNEYLREFLELIGSDKYLTFHKLRDSFAINMLELGYSKEVLQKLMGHGSITNTEKYARMTNKAIDNELDKFL